MQQNINRLAYLVSRYPAVSHTFILREVVGLRRRGFDIRVASINAPDRPPEELTAEERAECAATFYVKAAGVRGALGAHVAAATQRPLSYFAGLLYALGLGGSDLKRIARCFCYFVEAVMVGRWMEAQGATHLHVHFATPASTVGLIVKRIFAASLSITVHGPDEFYDAPGYLLAEKVAAASFICCIGTYSRSQLMHLSHPTLWSKFEVSPLGVDPELFIPRAFRARRSHFEILCVGRLVPAKGQQVLIDAVARLVEGGSDVLLRFVGDGPDRETLEDAARSRGLQGRVVFEGAVNQDRIREMYETADAFALASFAEGIPVVLMEAMAMEIPCVTTNITGIHELIRHNVDGLLVSPSDADELANALALLIGNRGFRQLVGQAGRERVIEKYNLNKNTARLASIFLRRLAPNTHASI